MGKISLRSRVRKRLTQFAAFVVATVFAALLGQATVSIAEDFGWFSLLEGGRMMQVLEFLTSPAITHIAVLTTGVALGSWLDAFIRRKEDDLDQADLEIVSGKRFQNEEVNIDGKSFVKCTFSNVTLAYKGGIFGFDRCTFSGGLMIKPKTGAGERLVHLLHEMGYLKRPVLDEHGVLARNTKDEGSG